MSVGSPTAGSWSSSQWRPDNEFEKDECLAKLILVGEPALRTAVRAYVEHFHGERNHQGKGNLLLFPCEEMGQNGPVRCRERLGGLLKFYYRPAA